MIVENHSNPEKTCHDIACAVFGKNNDELCSLLEKYNQEAAACIEPDGDVSFDILDESKRKRIVRGQIGLNLQHVCDFAITFQEGDSVRTRDGREGIVLGSQWIDDLALYRYNDEPRVGYFLVIVDFGEHTELHIRNDLTGERFRKI